MQQHPQLKEQPPEQGEQPQEEEALHHHQPHQALLLPPATAVLVEEPEPLDSTDDDNDCTTYWYYQNPQTGQVAAHTLTLRQLCRLVQQRILSPETHILQLRRRELQSPNRPNNCDSSKGHSDNNDDTVTEDPPPQWTRARSHPVLRAAMATAWYYCIQNTARSPDDTRKTKKNDPAQVEADKEPQDNDDDAAAAAAHEQELEQQEEGTVRGPVDCRQLATVLNQHLRNRFHPPQHIIHNYNDKYVIRVYSADAMSPPAAWTRLEDVPHLQLALCAFMDDDNDKMGVNQDPDPDRVEKRNAPTTTTTVSSTRQPSCRMASSTTAKKDGKNNNEDHDNNDDLEDFLSSMIMENHHQNRADLVDGENDLTDPDENDNKNNNTETYESDGGTVYVKDHQSGRWVHEALNATTRTTATTISKTNKLPEVTTRQELSKKRSSRKKHKPSLFSARKARCWVYATGLPLDTTAAEVARFFSKAGVLDLDPETLQPKIKLYNHNGKGGGGSGDASICYARHESVELAVTLLDEAPFRPTVSMTEHVVHVEPARFEAHHHADNNDDNNDPPHHDCTTTRVPSKNEEASQHQQPPQPQQQFTTHPKQKQKRSRPVSAAQRKVAKLAARQAVDWDGGEINSRLTGGRKGLRIIVLKHVFTPPSSPSFSSATTNTALFFEQLERELRTRLETFGPVEKITVFSSNPEGVVIVKYATPGNASEAVRILNGSTPWIDHKDDSMSTLSSSSSSSAQSSQSQQPQPHRPRHQVQGQQPVHITAIYWDGVTDYSVVDFDQKAREEAARQEEFGDWLDHQEDLPPELQLQTE